MSIRDLIEESRSCLHSKGIEEEINKIDIVLKWRDRICRKLTDQRESPFNEGHHLFMRQI